MYVWQLWLSPLLFSSGRCDRVNPPLLLPFSLPTAVPCPPPPFSLSLSEHVTTSPLHRFQPDPPCAKPKQPPTPSSVRYVPPSTLRWPVRLSRSEAALLSHLLRPNVG